MHSSSFKLQHTSGVPSKLRTVARIPRQPVLFFCRRKTAPGTPISRSRKQNVQAQDTVGDVGRLDRRKVAPGVDAACLAATPHRDREEQACREGISTIKTYKERC